MERFLGEEINLKQMSPLALAFMGDAVFSLFVREYLVSKGNSNVKKLHTKSVEMVRCEWQSQIIKDVLMDVLTEEEKDVYTRGRNAKVGHVPKNSSVADYHSATGFETMFGYIYLKGDILRLKELFCMMAKAWEESR